METCICPICSEMGLLEAPIGMKQPKRAIVHENEHFKHLRINGVDYLARTKQNVTEELGLAVDGDMVLN